MDNAEIPTIRFSDEITDAELRAWCRYYIMVSIAGYYSGHVPNLRPEQWVTVRQMGLRTSIHLN